MLSALIVEDYSDAESSLKPILSLEGFEVVSVTADQVQSTAADQAWDLVLINVPCLRDSDLRVITMLRNLFIDNWRPILLITGDASEIDCISALDAGVDDCLVQPFSSVMLSTKIKVMLRIASGQKQLGVLVNELTRISQQDSLTKLYNRNALFNKAEYAWLMASRKQQAMSILMLDVDHFKLYNDACGHIQGDNCLVVVSETIRQEVQRETDLVGRYGGEEFIVVLPETNAQAAKQIAERLCRSVEAIQQHHPRSDTAKYVTVSIGLATCVDARYCTLRALLEYADENLYGAKDLGRNCVVSTEHENPTTEPTQFTLGLIQAS